MDKYVEKLELDVASKFEQSVVSVLMKDDYESKYIKARVLDACFKAELIEVIDRDVYSERFDWVEKVIEMNLASFKLLDIAEKKQIKAMSLREVREVADAKVEAIIKNIVKRVLNAPQEFPMGSNI
ncbi:hypothetical protein [Oceanisphaera arctica]|nr:hypothetical protein [Oceanisphaera arctica]GHA05324.1 hypothetical protein GCM10007082_02760 [Oceanisphaera arctica]